MRKIVLSGKLRHGTCFENCLLVSLLLKSNEGGIKKEELPCINWNGTKRSSLSAFWIVSIWVWNITNKHISKENPNEWLIAIYFENCPWQLHCRGSGCLDTRNGQPELTALSSVLHLRTASCPKLTAVWFALLKGQRRTQFPWLSYSSRLNRSWFAEEP